MLGILSVSWVRSCWGEGVTDAEHSCSVAFLDVADVVSLLAGQKSDFTPQRRKGDGRGQGRVLRSERRMNAFSSLNCK